MVVSHPFVFKCHYKSMHKPIVEHIGSLLLQHSYIFQSTTEPSSDSHKNFLRTVNIYKVYTFFVFMRSRIITKIKLLPYYVQQ